MEERWRKKCNEMGIGYYEIGDAGMARRALNATREAFDAALNFDKPEEHAYVSRPKKLVFVTGSDRHHGTGDHEAAFLPEAAVLK